VDFGFTEAQEQLRAAVRDYLAKETPVSFARAMSENSEGITDTVWRELARLGWLGLGVAERWGGSGMAVLDLVVLMEESGAVVFPGPLFSTLALAVPMVSASGDEDQCSRLLGGIARGECRVAIAVVEQAGLWEASALGFEVRRDRSGYCLRGSKLFVADARSADSIIVVAPIDEGIGFFEVDAAAAGVSIEAMKTIDRTRKLDVVEFAGVCVDESALLGGRAYDNSVFDELVDLAKVALSAEMCGAADAALAMSVEYAKVRSQFGRTIGSFQAIQHRLADMKVMLENAKSLVYYAAWAIDSHSEDRRLACAMAKAAASDSCTRVGADAIQVHGGIAFTWEHDMQLYFKRLKGGEHSYGDASANREQVARLLEL